MDRNIGVRVQLLLDAMQLVPDKENPVMQVLRQRLSKVEVLVDTEAFGWANRNKVRSDHLLPITIVQLMGGQTKTGFWSVEDAVSKLPDELMDDLRVEQLNAALDAAEVEIDYGLVRWLINQFTQVNQSAMSYYDKKHMSIVAKDLLRAMIRNLGIVGKLLYPFIWLSDFLFWLKNAGGKKKKNGR